MNKNQKESTKYSAIQNLERLSRLEREFSKNHKGDLSVSNPSSVRVHIVQKLIMIHQVDHLVSRCIFYFL